MVGVDTPPPPAAPTAAGTDEVDDDTEGDSKGAMAFILQLKGIFHSSNWSCVPRRAEYIDEGIT